MNCPVDNEVLQMTERQDVEIDYCPRCRGVWLDRGELDKIIERASDDLPDLDERVPQYREDREDRFADRRRFDDRPRDRDQPHYGKKKKRSFLSDMFEFGDD